MLGVRVDATPSQIRAAYRRLAKTHHPDLYAGSSRAAARMARFNSAKTILLDPEVRAAYDAARGSRLARSLPPVARPPTRQASVHPTAVPRSVSREPIQSRSSWVADRQTVLLLTVALPLLGALLFYVADAAQVATHVRAASASDLALAPVSRPSAEGTARTAFVLVAGQPPSARAASAANRVLDNLTDGSPENAILRSIGRRLIESAAAGDERGWSQAVSELCVIGGTCQSPRSRH